MITKDPSLKAPLKYKAILIFGAPGSGKGTQGKTLGTIPGFFHCACGDVFRSLDTSTRIGQAFLEYSGKGELVPDEITVELWKVQIKSKVEGHFLKPDKDYLILDGIPRNINQFHLMKDSINVVALFHLTSPSREELYRRLKQRAVKDNRLDDANEQVIKQRLETYEEESKPLLAHFPKKLIKEIDSTQPPIRVLHEIINTILSLKLSIA